MGRLFEAFHGNGMTGQQFCATVLRQYLGSTSAAVRPAAQANVYSQKNSLISCSVPSTTKLIEPMPALAVKAKTGLSPLQTDATKAIWDKATISEICSEYAKAGKKLPTGEPTATAGKLETLCTDKRLKK
jgi:hypothetical protein